MSIAGPAFQGNAFTTVRGDVFIPEIWSNEIKRYRDANFIMADTCKKINMVGRKGDKLHIPGISRLAIYDKIPETPVTLQARTESEYTIVIDKYKEASILIEDILMIQADYPLMSEYTREIGYALARDIDNYILSQRAVIGSAINGVVSQKIYNTSDGTSTGNKLALSKAAILAARQILQEVDAPEPYVIAVSPGQYNDLLTITEFTSGDFVDGRPVATGEVGRLFGMSVRVSSNISVNSATGYTNGTGAPPLPTPGFAGSPYLPTQLPSEVTTLTTLDSGFTTAIVCSQEWCILAIQKNPNVESSRENMYQANALVSTQVYGAKVYRPDHAVIIMTAP